MEQTTQAAVAEAPISITPVATEQAAPVAAPVPEQNLFAKISSFRKSQPAAEKTQGESFFDYKEIESIQDPVAKEIAIKAYKSMQGAFTQKTQEVSVKRKEVESMIEQSKSWSPQRIQQELLNNPEFLQAAQQIAGETQQNPATSGLTNEEYSALSDSEKQVLASLKNEVSSLKQINFQSAIAQHDSMLQTKFPDYNPVEISRAIDNLGRMNLLEIREHVYKATNHDKDVQDAYELGKREARGLNQEKVNAISATGFTSSTSDSIPTKNKGESDQMFFVRLAQFRLAQNRRK